jgi:hypothetical protein
MTELKLAKLPDRTPVKMTLTVSPDLNKRLSSYAELYRQAYGTSESVVDLIPFMLDGFLKADRNFLKATRQNSENSGAVSRNPITSVKSARSGA